MLTHLNKKFPLLIIGSGLLIAVAILTLPVFASSPFDIEFPIPELGNCSDKSSCKVYCENDDHLEVCQTFATKHGFGATDEEIKKTLKELQEDGGPGGCSNDEKNPTLACKRYCDNSANIEECVSYAEKHGLMEGQELKEAQKVVSALKRGVKLPPQCQTTESCKATCEDPKDLLTARACFEFGKEAGLLPEGVSVEQAEKAFSALESGKGPFKSFAEMRQCDNPPTDEIMQKCIDFAVDAGFIPPEEVEIIKKTGGKGPGGCRGKDQCQNYCEANQDECFKFGEEHNLIREEDKVRMKEGTSQMQKALADAPPEVKTCIQGAIPELDAILTGEKMPSPSIGDKMKECFENFFKDQAGSFREGEGFGEPQGGEGQSRPGGQRGMGDFPPEVKKCLLGKFGEEFFTTFGKERPSPDVEAKMGECFKAMGGENRNHENQTEDSGKVFRKDKPCPAMPTVTSCGEGEELIKQEFPGCGVYSRCVSRGARGAESSGAERYPLPVGDQSSDDYKKEYQKQFDRQFKTEFQNQYRQETERQMKEQTEKQMKEQYQGEFQKYQGGTAPSGENYSEPNTFSPPSSGTNIPPPSDTEYHPPEKEPAPESYWFSPDEELLGSVYSAIRNLRNR